MAHKVHLICLGKFKDKALEAIESDYLKRLSPLQLTIHELKAQAEDKEKEGKKVWDYIQGLNESNTHLVLLDEKGKNRSSVEMSKWLFDLMDDGKKPVFVIGGAEGHGEFIRQKSQEKVSLSSLTFPHKLARIFFVEQIYRAKTINQGHPYHN